KGHGMCLSSFLSNLSSPLCHVAFSICLSLPQSPTSQLVLPLCHSLASFLCALSLSLSFSLSLSLSRSFLPFSPSLFGSVSSTLPLTLSVSPSISPSLYLPLSSLPSSSPSLSLHLTYIPPTPCESPPVSLQTTMGGSGLSRLRRRAQRHAWGGRPHAVLSLMWRAS